MVILNPRGDAKTRRRSEVAYVALCGPGVGLCGILPPALVLPPVVISPFMMSCKEASRESTREDIWDTIQSKLVNALEGKRTEDGEETHFDPVSAKTYRRISIRGNLGGSQPISPSNQDTSNPIQSQVKIKETNISSQLIRTRDILRRQTLARYSAILIFLHLSAGFRSRRRRRNRRGGGGLWNVECRGPA